MVETRDAGLSASTQCRALELWGRPREPLRFWREGPGVPRLERRAQSPCSWAEGSQRRPLPQRRGKAPCSCEESRPHRSRSIGPCLERLLSANVCVRWHVGPEHACLCVSPAVPLMLSNGCSEAVGTLTTSVVCARWDQAASPRLCLPAPPETPPWAMVEFQNLGVNGPFLRISSPQSMPVGICFVFI